MVKRPRRRLISATSAAKNFGRLIEHVRCDRTEYVVERSGVPAVRIIPAGTSHCTVTDLAALLKGHDRADEEYLKTVESGMAALNTPSVPGNPWER
jgi:hypothetical protein